MDQLAAIRVFVRVGEAGGFSEAARRLGLSKSAVSKHISALEDHLGIKLVYRTTRQVRLTEEGLAYVERARRLLEDLEEADSAVRSLRAEAKGRLRVNAAQTFGALHVAPALADFCRENPGVTVDLDLNDRFVDVVDEGYDLALRIGELTDMSLIARQLAPARLAVVASPGYIEAHGEPDSPDALSEHACLLYKGRRGSTEWRLVHTGPAPEQEPTPDSPDMLTLRVNGPLVTNSGDALKCAVLDGLGVAQLPTFAIAPELANGRLVRVMPDWQPPTLTIHAVYPPNRHLSAKVRAFIDFLAARFGPNPQWDRSDWKPTGKAV